MNQHEFLDRMVAPGNFIAIAVKGTQSLFHRFYERSNVAGASRFLGWAVSKGLDSWYAVASYMEATHKSDDKYTGSRTQKNAQNLKAFWFDADIKREGDGKDEAKAFADIAELIAWVRQFRDTTGIPLPNLWVCSGFGLHLYWTFEEALERSAWQPYAEALKAALLAHGSKGDASITTDAARILRPIDSFNFKVPTEPMPTFEFMGDRLTRPDYPNETLLGALAALPQYKKAEIGHASAMFAGQPRMTANAKTGLDRRPHDFALIADRCGQVRRSLEEGGAKDERELWHYLVSLAWFCEDGNRWAHEIGNQHSKYTESDTDREFDQVAKDHAKKPFGAPLCKTLAGERGGICEHCPHRDVVATPFSLGVDDDVDTDFDPEKLPKGYRRAAGQIEYFRKAKNKQEEDGWARLIYGDVSGPVLERVDNHLRFSFTYSAPFGETFAIEAENVKVEALTIKRFFTAQGVPLNLDNAIPFTRLVMAWVDLLTRYGGDIPQAAESPPAFGWHKEPGGKILGLSLGGIHYAIDGTEHRVRSTDVKLVEHYQPRGSLEQWQRAAALIVADRPELQIALAASFGAPLMDFTGEAGACLNFVGKSGTGKSSAFRAGAGVWGAPTMTMAQLSDTENFISHCIGTVRAFPIYWDEVKVSDRWKANEMKELLHKLTQGREKGRLTAEVQKRAMHDWQTLFPFASNDSVVAALSNLGGDNSATVLRLLEISVDAGAPITPSVAASQIVRSLDDNYGQAGREYVKYVVQHTDEVGEVVRRCKQHLIDKVEASNDERFYISSSAAVLAGALIARELNLVSSFDIPAMKRILIAAIKRSRIVRGEYAPTDSLVRARNALAAFCNEYEPKRVITTSIPQSGFAVTNLSDKFVVRAPLGELPLAYQIGVQDKVLRINKRIWNDWCFKRGLSPESLLDDMREGEWVLSRLKDPRGVLGAGTAWSSGRLALIELDLNLDDLSHLIPASDDKLGGNVIPLQRPPA